MSENIAATLRNLVYNGADEATMHKAMLEAADVLESIAADLDTLREFTKELAKRNEELHKEKLAAVLHVPRWISVEDEQKPKHHEEVLCRYVFDGDSECFYAVLTYYAYGDNGYVTGQHFTCEGLHDMRVTHWMPLPAPPEEG